MGIQPADAGSRCCSYGFSRGQDADETMMELKTPRVVPGAESISKTTVDGCPDSPMLSARAVINAGHSLSAGKPEEEDAPPEGVQLRCDNPQILLDAVRALLNLMGAVEDDILFYSTWAELVWCRAIVEVAHSGERLGVSL